ncbi:hypothetical protein E4U91_36560 [Streptomyces lasalocidi]|uniref:Uncharacterized protein n=1 Tax=Streptomyces lasalocidi TaxID=324833 RepID=A0A4V6AUJ5_STRLS|nr:hypothetical protein E4U91_36560 [Streptomyces lasalocidi]
MTVWGAKGCSPRPRGWSLHGPDRGVRRPVLPVPAGMVPTSARRWRPACSAPRTPRGWSRRLLRHRDGEPVLPVTAAMTSSP